MTLSSNLLYSKNINTIEDFLKRDYYNILVKTEYEPKIDDYIEGLEFRSCDWRELFDEFKEQPNVIFIADPPISLRKQPLKLIDIYKENNFIVLISEGILDFLSFLVEKVNFSFID